MKKISSIAAVCFAFLSFGQSHRGEIKDVKQTSLHQINIDPTIRAAAGEDLAHLRILDSKKNQVPYAFNNFNGESSRYIPFKVIAKNIIKDSITSIVIKNETGKKINQLNIKIRNTSLAKNYNLSGSNDNIEWFGLTANQTLADLNSANETSSENTIYFPANTYAYLRIDVKDKNSLPINIESIGIYETQFIPEKLIEIAEFTYKIIEDKQKKTTKVVFSAANNYHIDAIAFDIADEYFNRTAKLLLKRERKIKKRIMPYEEVSSYFDLSSKRDKIIYFNNLNEKEFTIEIENLDNQALIFSKIQLLQKPLVILAKLNANESYELIIDSILTKPSYDLENFVSKINSNVPEGSISNFNRIVTQEQKDNTKPLWQSQLFMWICILIVGAGVGYFAYSLLKDMKE